MAFKVNSGLDLHIHTYYSDGEDSPKDAVLWAAESGAVEIAITDHDNVDGVMEAKAQAEALGMVFHSGIEFSTADENDVEMHLLGYDIDIENEKLKEICKGIAVKRKARNDKMMALLNEKCSLQYEDVITRENQSFIGKPMMARALVKKGCAESFQEAFDEILEQPEFKKIKKEKISIYDGIDVIKAAGGKAVLAHPGLIKSIGKRGSEEFYGNVEILLEKLKARGLEGLECVYRKHTEEEEKRFLELADKHGLFVTRGTDYHGSNSL